MTPADVSIPQTRSRRRDRRRRARALPAARAAHRLLRLLRRVARHALLVAGSVLLLVGPVRADTLSGIKDRIGVAPNQHRQPPVRVLASRSHTVCPLPGGARTVRTIDSRDEWREALNSDEAGALGRRVLWSREKVLIYAKPQQAADHRQLEVAGSRLRLQAGVLWWPIKEVAAEPIDGVTPVSAGRPPRARPCVIAAVSRAQWHRVRIVEVGGD